MRISTTNTHFRRACYRLSQLSSTVLLLSAMSGLAIAANDIPSKGMTQDQVRNNFGEPNNTKPAVGQPPISRWDYDNYSVYFEKKYVIHSFLHDQKLRPQINPKPSMAEPESSAMPEKAEQQSKQSAPAMPDQQSAEPQVNEELEQTEQQDMEKEVEEEMQAAAPKEKDLNFEEASQEGDFGKWAN